MFTNQYDSDSDSYVEFSCRQHDIAQSDTVHEQMKNARVLQTLIHLISRSDGQTVKTFETDAFFYLHIVNQFEEDGCVVIDICCYRDPSMINCMYIEALQVNGRCFKIIFRVTISSSSSSSSSLGKSTF